jgi:hypothetical protein
MSAITTEPVAAFKKKRQNSKIPMRFGKFPGFISVSADNNERRGSLAHPINHTGHAAESNQRAAG